MTQNVELMQEPLQQKRLGKTMYPNAHTPIWATKKLFNDTVSRHFHDFIEVAIVLKGEGVHCSSRGEEEIYPGDTFVIGPGAWHSYRDCKRLSIFNCHFSPELLHRELSPTVQDPLLNYLLWTGPLALNKKGIVKLHLSPESVVTCTHHLKSIIFNAPGDPISYVEQIGHVLIFLGQLAKNIAAGPHVSIRRRTTMHPAVRDAIELLEKDYGRQWTLSELAGHLYLDRSYLGRIFKHETGLSPLAYLGRYRAEKAAALLLQTERTVSEIGHDVGWPDPNYFARRFKAYFGLSASLYRSRFSTLS